MLILSACGSTTSNNNFAESNAVVEQNKEKKKSNNDGEMLFSVNYDVEDYCDGYFIVSKSDGLLYGLLDMDGKEVIPIKYDEMEFLNKKQVIADNDNKIYLKIKYEGKYSIIDTDENVILDNNVARVNYIFDDSDNNSPFFVSINQNVSTHKGVPGKLQVFTEDGNIWEEFGDGSNNKIYYNFTGISKDLFMIETIDNHIINSAEGIEVNIYDSQKNVIKHWDNALCTGNCSVDDLYKFTISLVKGEVCEYKGITVNSKGEFIEEKDLKDLYEVGLYITKNTDKNRLQTDEKRLYDSNSTYKLEYLDGSPVYDDRYYDLIEIKEKASCFALANEDKEYCLIDRNGIKRIDYGTISSDGRAIKFKGKDVTESIFDGSDSICIAVKNNGNTEVYYFDGSSIK
jgi:hypothetical protein